MHGTIENRRKIRSAMKSEAGSSLESMTAAEDHFGTEKETK